MTIPGFTSTGSKRPEALFGSETGVPRDMTRSSGCKLWDGDGKQYTDMIMSLGAVALGYAHPQVVEAVIEAAKRGTVGSLPPRIEQELALRLASVIPGAESIRFLKSGAEAVAAAVRLARVYTDRESVITCGYHGWLDWCQDEAGVPQCVKNLRMEVPFNDPTAMYRAVDESGPVAAIVVEPVIDGEPDVGWLQAARDLANGCGAVLIFDEVKTAFRVAVGGAAEQYGVTPDLMVVGKALGNGFPIAAVCGSQDVMSVLKRTWVSSTLATEYVALAAAAAVLGVFEQVDVVSQLRRSGNRFLQGLRQIASRHPSVFDGVSGVAQMCYPQCGNKSGRVAAAAAQRGVLVKLSAYNFVSLAHTDEDVDQALATLEEVADGMEAEC